MESSAEKTKVSPLLLANMALIMFCSAFYGVAAYRTVQIAFERRAYVAQTEQCIQDVAANRLPPNQGCEVIGGVAEAAWIRSLAAHRLTGFASGQ